MYLYMYMSIYTHILKEEYVHIQSKIELPAADDRIVMKIKEGRNSNKKNNNRKREKIYMYLCVCVCVL